MDETSGAVSSDSSSVTSLSAAGEFVATVSVAVKIASSAMASSSVVRLSVVSH